MSSLGSPNPFLFGGKKAYEVERSLRFNRDDNAYLSRTPSSAGNRKTFTFSAWFKLGQNGVNSTLNNGNGLFLSTGAAGTGTNMTLRVTNNGYVGVDYYGVGGYYSTNRLRDPSAWYHIVWVMDTTESTAANRFKVYVNGDLIYNNQAGLSQNADTPLNNNSATTIGAYSYNTSHGYRLDGHLAEVNFIDGNAYDPTYFAETNAVTGQWNPKKYTGSYGTNGFYLNFSDNSGTTATTLGKDSSGNGNNFTPNNFSVAAGEGNDSVEDTPTNNWATLNPLHHKAINTTFSNGNLQAVIPASNNTGRAEGNFVVYSGKWYWELKYTGNTGNYLYVGVAGADSTTYYRAVRGSDGELAPNTGTVSVSFTTNDIIMVALDVDNGKWYIGKNGSYMLSGDPVNGTGFVHSGLVTTYNGLSPTFFNATSTGSQTINVNFGQQGFTYTPPTDFKALNSANLPDPTIKLPNKYFDTLLYTGNDGTNNITGLSFEPDWVWMKNRSATSDHILCDQIRGLFNLRSNQTTAEQSNGSIHLQSFNSDGFTVAGTGSNSNSNGDSFVAWNWNGGGSTVTNNDGSISSQVRANTSAGFSIITYSGNSNSGSTVGHGLGVKPDLIIIKARNAGDNWMFYHKQLNNGSSPEQYYLELNESGQLIDDSRMMNDTAPTSTVFSLRADGSTNYSGRTYVAYCFSEVAGYSKFGSYGGNGNADGTFVFTGFRPAWVMMKRTDSTGNWFILDNKRDTFNEVTKDLYPNTSGTETDNANFLDFLSNGFKLRTTGTAVNAGTIIYLAFAESPFKNARAR